MVCLVIKSLPMNPSSVLLVHTEMPRQSMRLLILGIASRLSSMFHNVFDVWVLTVSPSDIESLKKGVVKTFKNRANAPYTILLVGETGVGKSSVLEFFANVLAGKDVDHYDFQILDHTNEEGGPDNQSQTNSARLYELRSNNGIIVRTSGFC